MELGFPVHHYLGNTSQFKIQGFLDTLTSEEWQETKERCGTTHEYSR
jgi:anti-anti-sigma regulatory factor